MHRLRNVVAHWVSGTRSSATKGWNVATFLRGKTWNDPCRMGVKVETEMSPKPK
jgi:hypothetical protein